MSMPAAISSDWRTISAAVSDEWATSAPAKPVITRSPASRRILTASAFITVLPSVTCPSPPRATIPLWRTVRIVVERIFIVASQEDFRIKHSVQRRIGRDVFDVQGRDHLRGRDLPHDL